MSITSINKALSNIDTVESTVCQAINAHCSRQGQVYVVLPRSVFIKRGQTMAPTREIVSVSIRCDGNICRNRNGELVYADTYLFNKLSSYENGNISLMDNGDVMMTSAKEVQPFFVGNINNLEVVEPEWTEWVDSSKVESVSGSMSVPEALTAIREATEALDPYLSSPFSHGGVRVLAPSFVQTATEGAVAYAKTKADESDIYLPTFARSKMPLPYGGIDGKTANKKGFTQEDTIQMKGNDFQRLPTSLKARSNPKLDGQTYDTKLIASVSSPFYSRIPVEAFTEHLKEPLDSDTKFNWEASNLWTWSAKHTADIVYVIRNKAYFVSKDSLRLKVRKEIKKFKEDGFVRTDVVKPNTIKKGESYEQNKWCVYLSEDDILHISYQVLDLPKFYGELMEKYAEDVMDFYAANKGDEYIVWHLKNYSPNI